MAKHEFGIIPKAPSADERFDTYEPQRYQCIAVDDDLIEPIMKDLRRVDCYWHTLQMAGKGLAYTGITLIPPESMEAFINILSSYHKGEYAALIGLAVQAKGSGNYIIHFGI